MIATFIGGPFCGVEFPAGEPVQPLIFFFTTLPKGICAHFTGTDLYFSNQWEPGAAGYRLDPSSIHPTIQPSLCYHFYGYHQPHYNL